MQFGRVLAFATLVIASPTPAILERDNVQFSASVVQYLNSLTSSINTAVSGKNANDIKALTSVTLLNAAAVLSAGKTAATNVYTAIQAAETTALSGLANAADTAGSATLVFTADQLANIKSATNDLAASLNKANSLLSVTASLVLTGVDTTVAQELQATIKLVNSAVQGALAIVTPFTGPLSDLQASLDAAAKFDPTALVDVVSAVKTFASKVSNGLVTVSPPKSS